MTGVRGRGHMTRVTWVTGMTGATGRGKGRYLVHIGEKKARERSLSEEENI